jgi:predicted kinase
MLLAPDDLLPPGPARWTRETVSAAWQTCRRQLREALAHPAVERVLVLVGVPGSGKSTWARDHEQPDVVVFDACWAEPGRRAALAAQIRAAGKVPIAVWVRTPLEVCRERNALRPPDRRVPDVALLRAAVALRHAPPTVAEGWAAVWEVDGEAQRVHDAKLTPEEQLERAAQAPSVAAWKALKSKILPALAKAQPGQPLPADLEKHLAALSKSLAKSTDKTAADVAKIGAKIEGQQLAQWDQIVAKGIGSPWQSTPNEQLVGEWSTKNAAKIGEISAGIVPGLRAAIQEAHAKGKTAAQLAAEWRESGLPLAGFGTAEGRAKVLALGSSAELASASLRSAQEALDCDQYEWGPTTSKNPDPEHAARRGKRFRWSEPPPDGHPGERHGCHCTAKPVISLQEAKELKAALGIGEPAPPAAPLPLPKPAPAPVAPPEPAAPKPAPVVASPPPPPAPAPAPKPKPKPKPKPEPGGWKPLPAPAPIAKPAPPPPPKPKPAPIAPPAAPPPPPPEPPKAPTPPRAQAPRAGQPASWAVRGELETKALREASPAQRVKLEKTIERDQPVHRPNGPRTDTKGSSAAAKAWGKTLSDDQLSAIEDWSENGFTEMRAVDGGILGSRPDKMRTMSSETYIHRRKQLADLRDAMRTAPRYEGTLYRGLRLPPSVPDAAAYFQQLTTKGAEFQLESLSSWSHNKSVSQNQFSADVPGGLLVRISKSTRGVPINAEGLSHFGASEGEVLLDKGGRYRVVKVWQQKGDQHRMVVDLEEID